MAKLWLTVVPLASFAAVLMGIHCLVRYQSFLNHHQRSDGSFYGNMFPRRYHASGILSLPFDDIHEPFEAWYAGDVNISRIDYYHGKKCSINQNIPQIGYHS